LFNHDAPLIMNHNWPWLVLALLGAYHGLNPGMGWLFALSLGLQEKRRSAVVAALVPIAIGHAAAIAATILLFRFAQDLFPGKALRFGVAAILFTFGIYRIFRASHPRGAGMRVGTRDLLVWSFLMASAHGAGLMIVPVLLAQPMLGMAHSMPGSMQVGSMQVGSVQVGSVPAASMPTAPPSVSMPVLLLAVTVHTLALLIVAGVLAILFFESYDKVGLKLLRHTWLNFDLLWAFALLVAGCGALLS
jgi:hypothetical protein